MDFCEKDYQSFLNKFVESFRKVNVLDVGCGTGGHTVLLKGIDNKVFGTDITDVRRKEHCGVFNFFLSKPGKIAACGNQFDLVTNMDVLEHVVDDEPFIREMHRVTKLGGHVLTITPNKYRLSNILRVITRFKKLDYPMNMGKDVYGDCIHIREYTSKEVGDLFIKSGFKSVNVTPFWFGLRIPMIDRIRIAHGIPFPLSSVSQYIIVDAIK